MARSTQRLIRFAVLLLRAALGVRVFASAIAASAVIVISGCSPVPTHDYSSARADLDPQSGQINLPLESFAMTWSEEETVNHANALITLQCMKKHGFTFPRATQDWAAIPPLPDRRYGIWSRADAEANGYELPPSPQSAEVDAKEAAFGDDWWSTFQSCYDKQKKLPVMGVNSSPSPSVVDNGMNSSFDALLASSDFSTQKERWQKCVEGKGLSLNPKSRVLVPQIPAAGERQIEVASLDVECKERLNTVQVLANWETRNQLAYIDGHEGELAAYKAQVKKVIAEAQKVISSVGE